MNNYWSNFLINYPEYSQWWNILPQNYQVGGDSDDIVLDHSLVNQCVRFDCEQHRIECRFKTVNKTFAQAKNELTELFIKIHRKMLSLINNKDQIRITFFHEDFSHGIGYPFMDKNQLQNTNLQDKFDAVCQSYRTVNMNSNNALTAQIIIAHLPSGSGKKRQLEHDYSTQQDYFDDNLNYITIFNEDNFCLIRAVIIAIAYIEKDKDLNKLLRYRSTLLLNKTLDVAKKCQIENEPSGINEIKKLEVFFKDYQITLINNNGMINNEPIFVGELSKKFIYISFTGSHYNVIKSMPKFVHKSYYCHFCKVGYNNRTDHHCKNPCKKCNRINCDAKIFAKCEFCNVNCNDKKCLNLHQSKICKKTNICETCFFPKHGRFHICQDQKYCKNCKKC